MGIYAGHRWPRQCSESLLMTVSLVIGSMYPPKRISDREFEDYDLIIALDRSNLASLRRRFGDSPKIRMLLDRDVADPWYTDDFVTAYDDILKGCERLLDSLA